MQHVRRLTRRFRTVPVWLLLLPLVACGAPTWEGIAIDPPREVPSFTFALPSGDTVRTAPEADRPTMVFFGYTHCPDVCPLTLADWAKIKRELGADGARVRWYFVTVDPTRDTPTVAQAYAQQFDSAFVGLSGDSATVTNMQRAFGVTSYQTPGASDADYLVSHSSQVFALDERGRLVTMYPFNGASSAMLADLRQLLR